MLRFKLRHVSKRGPLVFFIELKHEEHYCSLNAMILLASVIHWKENHFPAKIDYNIANPLQDDIFRWYIDLLQSNLIISLLQEVEKGHTGFTLSICLSVRLSVCGQNHVRNVSSTILAGSMPCLDILSSNFKRCVLCITFFTIKLFEVLANF